MCCSRMKQAIHPEGDIYTPYGATEALPVASISASEVLAETAAQTARGRGTCVGKPFSGIRMESDWDQRRAAQRYPRSV